MDFLKECVKITAKGLLEKEDKKVVVVLLSNEKDLSLKITAGF